MNALVYVDILFITGDKQDNMKSFCLKGKLYLGIALSKFQLIHINQRIQIRTSSTQLKKSSGIYQLLKKIFQIILIVILSSMKQKLCKIISKCIHLIKLRLFPKKNQNTNATPALKLLNQKL